MNIAILTIAFNEAEFIKPCIKQFDGFGLSHLVLISSVPWNGNYEMDHTWAIAQMFNENGMTHIDKFDDSTSHYNAGLEMLESFGFDWALIVDADEFYTPYDLGRLIGEIRTTKTDAICCSEMSVYWKTPERLIIPRQNDNPIIAIKPNYRFDYIRNNNEVSKMSSMTEMHHMSYVRTDEAMKKKIETSAHSHEFDTNKWYKEKWLAYTDEMEDLHPVIPRLFKRATHHPAPSEIRSLLNG